MNIGHYMRDIWGNGGIASYIRRIADAQEQAGHRVFYFDTLRGGAASGDKAEPVEQVRDEADLFDRAVKYGLDILHVHTGLSGDARRAVPGRVPLIRTVHEHQPYCPSGTRYLARQRRACDRAYSVGGCLWGHLVDRCGSARPRNIQADFRRTRSEMRTLPHISVIADSHFVKAQMLRSGYPENGVHVLHYPAAEVVGYSPPPRETVARFVFLGRIVPQKGLDWLLRALREVKAPARLEVLGTGYQEAEMRELAQRLGITDRVTFHGWMGPEQVNHFVASARAVLFPSVWHEPAGLVTLDAAANGRAVIGSRVGGLPEYALAHESALLVDPHDVPGLAGAIDRLAQDWTLAQRLGEAGRHLARERFSLPGHLNALMDLYAAVKKR